MQGHVHLRFPRHLPSFCWRHVLFQKHLQLGGRRRKCLPNMTTVAMATEGVPAQAARRTGAHIIGSIQKTSRRFECSSPAPLQRNACTTLYNCVARGATAHWQVHGPARDALLKCVWRLEHCWRLVVQLWLQHQRPEEAVQAKRCNGNGRTSAHARAECAQMRTAATAARAAGAPLAVHACTDLRQVRMWPNISPASCCLCRSILMRECSSAAASPCAQH
jgi:hypothetical protein